MSVVRKGQGHTDTCPYTIRSMASVLYSFLSVRDHWQQSTMVLPADKGFHIADYVIFAVVLAISIAIGLYHAFSGGKQRTTKEYLMGNRELKTLPVALSILVSFVSAILVLGTPAEMYTRGTQLFMRTIGYCLACVFSSLLFVPLFFSLKVTSSFEVSMTALSTLTVPGSHIAGTRPGCIPLLFAPRGTRVHTQTVYT